MPFSLNFFDIKQKNSIKILLNLFFKHYINTLNGRSIENISKLITETNPEYIAYSSVETINEMIANFKHLMEEPFISIFINGYVNNQELKTIVVGEEANKTLGNSSLGYIFYEHEPVISVLGSSIVPLFLIFKISIEYNVLPNMKINDFDGLRLCVYTQQAVIKLNEYFGNTVVSQNPFY